MYTIAYTAAHTHILFILSALLPIHATDPSTVQPTVLPSFLPLPDHVRGVNVLHSGFQPSLLEILVDLLLHKLLKTKR